MSQNKRPIVYVVKEEVKALGAAQIMLGLIHSALGSLWFFLYHLEDETHSVGPVLMPVTIIYMFVSGSLFINSGSSSVVQGDASACQLVFGIVMNTISIFVAIIGIIIFAVEFPAFEALGNEYIWSNMAGMMLLQISILCIISELVITVITVDLFRNTFHRPRLWDERE
ncbi:membrane-spanning 4-domains subfamily A member 12-like [Alexandromys fortis]|uniref:membrane-spanning 4-domains subfamily A member 12-like n=1 Tax=Alexandromys fortis TaxID=100897 RepID=UPI0021538E1E|nr:membrane-spanning 4-domains subfamily A member 12-like [Microtus fortis]